MRLMRFVRRHATGGFHFGFRGSYLAFCGVVSTYIALTLYATPSDTQTQVLAQVMPLRAFAIISAAAALACFWYAFRWRDALGFATFFFVMCLWAVVSWVAWIMGLAPRAFGIGVVYGIFAAMTLRFSAWPEPPATSIAEDVSDYEHPVALISTDGNGIVTGWGGAAESMFGWTSSDMVGRSASLLVPESRRADHEAGIARARRLGITPISGLDRDVTALHRDGTGIPVRIRVTLHRIGGVVMFSAAVSRRT